MKVLAPSKRRDNSPTLGGSIPEDALDSRYGIWKKIRERFGSLEYFWCVKLRKKYWPSCLTDWVCWIKKKNNNKITSRNIWMSSKRNRKGYRRHSYNIMSCGLVYIFFSSKSSREATTFENIWARQNRCFLFWSRVAILPVIFSCVGGFLLMITFPPSGFL